MKKIETLTLNNSSKKLLIIVQLLIILALVFFLKSPNLSQQEELIVLKTPNKTTVNATTTTTKTIRKKYLQYSCVDNHDGCGGLADRLKGIISSYALALLTNRAFLIDMQWPCPLERLLEQNQVDWVRKEEHLHLNETHRKLAGFLHLYNPLKSEDIIEFSSNSSDLLSIHSSMMFMNAFAENPLLKNRIVELGYIPKKFKLQFVFHEWFKKLFKLKKELEIEFQEMRKQVKKDQPGHKLICGQFREGIRTQTNLEEPGRFVRVNVSSSIFWQFMNETFLNKDKLNGSNFTIYVTTDSNQVKQEAKDFFGVDKVFTTSGKSNFHFSQDFGETKSNSESEQASVCSASSKIILDFLLLGECDMAVVSHSGFGLLGLWNRPDPGKDLYIYSTLDFVRRGRYSRDKRQFIKLDDLDEFYFYLLNGTNVDF